MKRHTFFLALATALPSFCQTPASPSGLEANKKLLLDFFSAPIQEPTKLLTPDYIQHNPRFLARDERDHPRCRRRRVAQCGASSGGTCRQIGRSRFQAADHSAPDDGGRRSGHRDFQGHCPRPGRFLQDLREVHFRNGSNSRWQTSRTLGRRRFSERLEKRTATSGR